MTEGHGIADILSAYRTEGRVLPQEEIVAMLREIQGVLGWIPQGVREKAAEAAGVKSTTVDAIIRLYPSLKPAPYRHQITVCQGRNCGPNGGNALRQEVENMLRPDRDGISADRQFLVKSVSCMKKCRSGPNLEIDGEVFAAVRPGDGERIIREIMKKEGMKQ